MLVIVCILVILVIFFIVLFFIFKIFLVFLIIILFFLVIFTLLLSFSFSIFFLLFLLLLKEGWNPNFYTHFFFDRALPFVLFVRFLTFFNKHILLLLIELVTKVVEVDPLVFIFLVGLGTHPLSPAVFPVAYYALQPARVLRDFFKVVTKATNIA